jgi:hypothetical protein
MNCKKARELMVLDMYGEADAPEKARLEEHLRGCTACASEKAETRRLFTLLDEHKPEEAPAADWEKAWKGIQSGIAGKTRAPRSFSAPRLSPAPRPFVVPRWRRAFAGAALIAVLAAGIIIGRFGFWPAARPEGGDAQAAAAGAVGASSAATTLTAAPPTGAPVNGGPNGIRPTFVSHLDDLKPILLDYAHYVPGEKTEGRVVVEEAALRTLMLQNVLLKRRLAEKDPAAADLLDDLDLILKEIVDRGSKDPTSPAQIRDLIEKRDVLFKMEILKKT